MRISNLAIGFPWVVLLGLLALAIFWKGGSPTVSPPNPVREPDQSSELKPAPGALGEEVRPASADFISLRVVDRLSDLELDLNDLALIDGISGDAIAFLGKEPKILDKQLLGQGYSWEYSIRFGPEDWAGRVFRVPESEASPDEDGTVHLPFFFGIRGSFSRDGDLSPIGNGYVAAWCVSQDRIAEVLADIKKRGAFPADIASSPFFLQRLLGRDDKRNGRFDARTNQAGEFTMFVPAVGRTKVHFWAPDYSPRNAEITGVPGQWSELHISSSPKPILRGRVIDRSGSPVPNATVKVSAVFGRAAQGLSPFEQEELGMAVIYATFGDDAACGLKTTVQTGPHGGFEVALPEAPRYSAAAYYDKGFGFTSLERPVPSVDGYIDIEVVVLSGHPGEQVPGFRIITESGRELPGIEVTTTIVDDFIWQRQFPEVVSGIDGETTLPWLEPGLRYGLSFKAKGLIKPFFRYYYLGDGDVILPNEHLLEREGKSLPVNSDSESQGGSSP
jgi:hypothetical protein